MLAVRGGAGVSEKSRIPLADARLLAAEVVAMLEPACERIEIAGSIRRQRPDVGDIEIVAIPRYQDVPIGLFGDRTEHVDLLADLVTDLLAAGTFEPRPDKNGHVAVNGKARRLLYEDFALDLFATDAECWGSVFLLRTGPAEFNKAMVAKRSAGGWLPRGFFFRDGRIWKLPAPYDANLVEHAWKLATPEEADVFRVLGFEYVEPQQRGETCPPLLAPAVRA